jgi:putative endonuclease
MSMYCYVYIVQCSNGGLYTGITSNLRRRIKQHNGIFKGGARYTKMHRPVFLQHIERYPTRKEAWAREKEIKSLDHKTKINLIDEVSKGDILSAI